MKQNILLAVGEDHTRETISGALDSSDFHIRSAASWITLLLGALSLRPEVVCLDPDLPGLSVQLGLYLLGLICGPLRIVLLPSGLPADELMTVVKTSLLM